MVKLLTEAALAPLLFWLLVIYCSQFSDEVCYVANVGDSRAFMSGSGGKRVFHLSKDHKPLETQEY